MAKPKNVIVKESIEVLKDFKKKASCNLISNRMSMLIVLKKHESTGISKRELALKVGINQNSAQKWRTLYVNQGIEGLLQHGRIGFKPSVFSKEQHTALETKLKDPKNGLRGYVELLSWAETEFKTTFKYNTILKYVEKNFGTKIKVARKSHVKKDEEAVETFKKTSDKAVKK